MAQAQGQVQNLGPAGERIAENIRRLRGKMTYRELSDRLAELGRPIPVLGLSRIESKARRVDVDDLMALALALDVSPAALLLPNEPTEPVQLTATSSAPWKLAWRWVNGELPLVRRPSGDVVLNAPAVAEFIREHRPYEDSNPVAEAHRLLMMRLPPGLTVRINVGSGEAGEVVDDG